MYTHPATLLHIVSSTCQQAKSGDIRCTISDIRQSVKCCTMETGRQAGRFSVMDKGRFWHHYSCFCWRFCRVKQTEEVSREVSRKVSPGNNLELKFTTFLGFCLTLGDLQPEENYRENVSARRLYERALVQTCYISLSQFLSCCGITLLSTDICVMWKCTINGRSERSDLQLSAAASDQHYGQIEHIVLPQSGMVWDTTEIT